MENFLTSLAELIFGENILNNTIEYITKIPAEFEAWDFIVNTVFKNTIVPFAAPLLICYFLYSVISEVIEGEYTFEKMFKSLVKLAFIMILFNNIAQILESVLNLSSQLVSSLSISDVNATAAIDISNSLSEITNNFKILQSISMFICLLIPLLISLGIRITISVITISRLIELMIRFALFPIAMADSFINQSNSTSVRYFKKFIALSLQSLVIIIITVIYSKLLPDFLSKIATTDMNQLKGFLTFSIEYSILGVAATAMIVKSQKLSEELLGV